MIQNSVDVLFTIGNVVLSLGTTLMIITLLRNRKTLSGYSIIGSMLTFIPLILFIIAYILMHNYIALAFASVTVLFWGLVCVFLARQRFHAIQR